MSTKVRRDRQVNVYLAAADAEYLDEIAQRRQLSRSAAARQILHDGIIEHARQLAADAPPLAENAAALLRSTGLKFRGGDAA